MEFWLLYVTLLNQSTSDFLGEMMRSPYKDIRFITVVIDFSPYKKEVIIVELIVESWIGLDAKITSEIIEDMYVHGFL